MKKIYLAVIVTISATATIQAQPQRTAKFVMCYKCTPAQIKEITSDTNYVYKKSTWTAQTIITGIKKRDTVECFVETLDTTTTGRYLSKYQIFRVLRKAYAVFKFYDVEASYKTNKNVPPGFRLNNYDFCKSLQVDHYLEMDRKTKITERIIQVIEK